LDYIQNVTFWTRDSALQFANLCQKKNLIIGYSEDPFNFRDSDAPYIIAVLFFPRLLLFLLLFIGFILGERLLCPLTLELRKMNIGLEVNTFESNIERLLERASG
jgi:hypothetical protein